MSFAVELAKAMDADPGIGPETTRINVRAVLAWPESRRKERVLRRMERHVAVHLMGGQFVMVWPDWSQVDWGKVLLTVLQVLAAILPLLLMLGDEDGSASV